MTYEDVKIGMRVQLSAQAFPVKGAQGEVIGPDENRASKLWKVRIGGENNWFYYSAEDFEPLPADS